MADSNDNFGVNRYAERKAEIEHLKETTMTAGKFIQLNGFSHP